MVSFKKLGRLFVIKTRLEAYLVTYAIAVGAIERGIHYLQSYPGSIGLVLAAACLGVPFIAGAKLLDSVRPEPVADLPPLKQMPRRPEPRRLSRSRPTARRSVRDSRSPSLRHTD